MVKFNIDQTLHRIALCKVIPGAESQVLKGLVESLEPDVSGANRASLSLFALGDFDLVDIRSGTFRDLEQNNQYSGIADRLLGYEELMCFGWSDTTDNVLDWKGDPAWVIASLKLDQGLRDEHGLPLEYAVAKWVEKRLNPKGREVRATTFGTLGRSEVVIVIAGLSMQAVMEAANTAQHLNVDQLSKWLPSYESNRYGKDRDENVFVGTFALPCLHIGSDLDGQINGWWAEDATLETLSDRLDFSVHVGCETGAIAHVERMINDWVSVNDVDLAVNRVFGDTGLIVRGVCAPEMPASVPNARAGRSPVHMSSARNLLRILYAVRHAAGVLSTATTLCVAGANERSTVVPTRVKDSAELADRRAIAFSEWLDHLLQLELRIDNPRIAPWSELAQLFARYRVAEADPLNEDLIRNLSSFVNRVFLTLGRFAADKKAHLWVDQETRRSLDVYSEVLPLFQTGLAQRLSGAHLDRWRGAGVFSGLRTYGVHRVLTVLDALVKASLASILDETGQPLTWVGFVVFDYPNLVSHLPFEVVNIRRHHLMRPHNWWRAVHACGHVLFDKVNFKSNPECANTIRRLTDKLMDLKRTSRRGEAFDLALDLVQEVTADIFTFRVGFGGNWISYRDAIWAKVDLQFDGVTDAEEFSLQFLRLMFVRLYFLEVGGAIRVGELLADLIQVGVSQNDRQAGDSGIQGIDLQMPTSPDDYFVRGVLGQFGSVGGLFQYILKSELMPLTKRCRHLFEDVNISFLAEVYSALEPMRWLLDSFFSSHMVASKNLSSSVPALAKTIAANRVEMPRLVPVSDVVLSALNCEAKYGLDNWEIALLLQTQVAFDNWSSSHIG